jgi:hypothetical protein
MVPDMLVRVLVFAAWAAIGAVASYGALYVLTPYGVAILSVCLVVGLWLPRRWPETLGLAAGPGILLTAAADATLIATGWAIVAAATITYLLVGRARCVS